MSPIRERSQYFARHASVHGVGNEGLEKLRNARVVVVGWGGVGLIVDGLDNFRTRYVLNNYSIRARVPYLFTSAIANQGHAALFQPPNNACLECIFPSLVSSPNESCESLGVTSSVVTTIGAIAANEAVKFLLGQTSRLAGSLLTLDLDGPDFIFSTLSKRVDCGECGECGEIRRTVGGGWDERGVVTILCGETSASIIPRSPQQLDLESISLKLRPEDMLSCSPNVLVYREDGAVISIFKNGRLILNGIKSEADAKDRSNKILERLGIQPNAAKADCLI